MVTVQCPNSYCETKFNTVGFRPITFNCPECNAQADWYALSRTGYMYWSRTDKTWNYVYKKALEEYQEAGFVGELAEIGKQMAKDDADAEMRQIESHRMDRPEGTTLKNARMGTSSWVTAHAGTTSGSTSLDANTETHISMDTEGSGLTGMGTLSGGNISVTSAGTYKVSAQIEYTAGTLAGAIIVSIYIAGELVKSCSLNVEADTKGSSVVSTIIDIASGGVVGMYAIYTTSAATVTKGSMFISK
jgi:hypothetical protein